MRDKDDDENDNSDDAEDDDDHNCTRPPAHPAPVPRMMMIRKPMTIAMIKMRIITMTRRMMMIAIGLGEPDTPGASQPPTPPPLFKATVANLMMANRRDCFFRNQKMIFNCKYVLLGIK